MIADLNRDDQRQNYQLMMKTNFWERRKHFDSYGTRPNEQAAGCPSTEARFTCPCCGYPSLRSWAEYEICRLCGWEDDGQDDGDADLVSGGPNGSLSLVEARDNFERDLRKHRPERDGGIGGPDSPREKEI